MDSLYVCSYGGGDGRSYALAWYTASEQEQEV
jgi:hypothetical protein